MGYKNQVNHEYFDIIDTEYKAYILGFIYADGAIIQPKGNRQMKLVISIQEEDGYILKHLNSIAGGCFRISNPPAIQKKGWKKRAIVEIVSDKLCQRLINLGCNIRKSQVGMKFPQINSSLIHHFIRGFLDGDGSILIKKISYKYIRKTTGKRKDTHQQRFARKIAFCSTDLVFLQEIAKNLNVSKTYYSNKLRKQLVHILWIERESDFEKSVGYLYQNASFYLERKFKKTIKSLARDTSLEGLETT